MTKDVLVQVSGLQIMEEENEPIVLIAPGTYYFKNGKHYFLYEEIDEDGEVSKNTIKVMPDMVDLIRKGVTSSHMVFEMGKENLTYYDTPFGSMLMGITTSAIRFREVSGTRMELEIDYALSMDGKHMSDCNIKINVTAKQ